MSNKRPHIKHVPNTCLQKTTCAHAKYMPTYQIHACISNTCPYAKYMLHANDMPACQRYAHTLNISADMPNTCVEMPKTYIHAKYMPTCQIHAHMQTCKIHVPIKYMLTFYITYACTLANNMHTKKYVHLPNTCPHIKDIYVKHIPTCKMFSQMSNA